MGIRASALINICAKGDNAEKQNKLIIYKNLIQSHRNIKNTLRMFQVKTPKDFEYFD